MLSLLSFSLVWFREPRRSAPKERDNVTATPDCGRVTAIPYSQLATRLGSLAIFLLIHLFTNTSVHICNRIPIITIHMPIRLNAVVRALTSVCRIQQQCDGKEFFNPDIICYPKSIFLNAVTIGFDYKCLDMVANLLSCWVEWKYRYHYARDNCATGSVVS